MSQAELQKWKATVLIPQALRGLPFLLLAFVLQRCRPLLDMSD